MGHRVMHAPKMKRKTRTIAIAGVLTFAASGGAFAYWTTTGAGTGLATNASANGTIVLHAGFLNGLTPGASEPVTYTADNFGTSSLFVGTITPVVGIDGGHPLCLAGDFTIPATASDVRVPAITSGFAAGSGTLSFADTGVSQDACKGAIVTLTLTSN